MQEEARSLATALFGPAALIFHLGFDQSQVVPPDWYQQADHPSVKAVAAILDQLCQWPDVEQLEFLVSSGGDPLTNLQVQLDRQIFQLEPMPTEQSVTPGQVCEQLQTQRIYVFSHHKQAD